MSTQNDRAETLWVGHRPPSRLTDTGASRCYVRFAAIGDSGAGGSRSSDRDRSHSWARVLALAIGRQHDVSLCDLTVAGATIDHVRKEQVPVAVAHRPHLTSFFLGLNETMDSAWDLGELRQNLLCAADELAWSGTVLLTLAFYDHALGLPAQARNHVSQRIGQLNEIYDEIRRDYVTIHLDLADHKEIYQPQFWSPDTRQPSERGHRFIAGLFAERLNACGLAFPSPVP